jgi:LCP family protein required for cell wall assembly
MPDKPYRVYRGGRRSGGDGDDPVFTLPEAAAPGDVAEPGQRRGPVIIAPPGGAGAPPPATPPRSPRPRLPWRRIVRIALAVVGVVVVLLGVWLVVGYLAFRSAVERANHRFETQKRSRGAAAVLQHQPGLLLSRATNVLVLGADKTGHSDSIQIVHSDPSKHLFATLSVPRDLRVQIPGHGADKINSAYFNGGRASTALAVRTIEQFTGLRINHVILVDFAGFRSLIDQVGGVDVVSPERIVSNKFEGRVWRFPKGVVHLDGRAALAYARVRKNTLNPADSDVTRGQRQQQVMRALETKLASFGSLFKLRSLGAHAVDPLSTDLSANQLLSLAWVKLRAQRTLTCHLGGTPITAGGVSYLSSSEENTRVLREVLGEVAVSPATPGDPFAPACSTR